MSSRGVVRRSLDAIAAENAKLHAFVEVFADAAMRRADELDSRAADGGAAGPLHGVPIAVKDLADIEGRVPGFGSKCFAAPIPARTAPAIRRLIDAGAVVIGMTHMVEFALGGWGTNHAVGTPWNPVDRAIHRVPGGSSSGSAVAVAAGIVPLAVGSDTGGSIRIPAALCGIVGFKPSYGLIALDGIAALAPTFDTLGPIGRSVADTRLMFRVMAGLADVPSEPARPLRIAVPTEAQLEPCDAGIAASFARSIAALRAMGHAIEALPFPAALTEYQALSGGMMGYEAFARHHIRVKELGDAMDPHVRTRILAGRAIDAARYAEFGAIRRRDISTFGAAFAGVDAIALPSTPLPAIPVAEVDESTIPMSRYTRVANWLDLCAISIPNGATASGLPTGLQLMAPSGADFRLLDLAERVAGPPS